MTANYTRNLVDFVTGIEYGAFTESSPHIVSIAMGRTIRLMDDERRKSVETHDLALRKPRPLEAIDYAAIEAGVLEGLHGFVVRPQPWRNTLKTKSTGEIATSMAAHFFARFRTQPHLDAVWADAQAKIEEHLTNEKKYNREPTPRFIRHDDNELERKLYYICVAQGGSLHKEYTRGFFTRSETHWFINAPGALGFGDAHWYAIARGYGGGLGRALKIAKTKLGRGARPITPFWKDVVRFFVDGDNLSVEAIDDLIDYLSFRLQENPDFNLRGRTVAALSEQMLQWHRDLARMKKIGEGNWTGLPVENWACTTGKDAQRVDWTMSQILTGKDLGAEGNAMRHCVATYKSACMEGRASIWSLRANDTRALTVEFDHGSQRVVQARGHANRLPRAPEAAILERWCAAMRLETLPSRRW